MGKNQRTALSVAGLFWNSLASVSVHGTDSSASEPITHFHSSVFAPGCIFS